MLDIGWSEMFLIAVVAIVVIGPKELPRALRTIGQWIGKARSMTRDLQISVNDMIAETEIDDLRKTANSIGDFNPDNLLDDNRSSDLNTSRPPPPTPQSWPPDDDGAELDTDDDFDASDEELAEWEAENAAKDDSSTEADDRTDDKSNAGTDAGTDDLVDDLADKNAAAKVTDA